MSERKRSHLRKKHSSEQVHSKSENSVPSRPRRTKKNVVDEDSSCSDKSTKNAMMSLDENVNRVYQRAIVNTKFEMDNRERIEKLSTLETFEINEKFDDGHPVQIVLARPEHKFELDEDALAKILLQDKIKDRSVVVVSIAGAFRKGKSFLLDFFLRYMESKYILLEDNEDAWLGKEDEPLGGFSWRGGSERDTTGILIWSKVFLGTMLDGEKVAVILMDTQGTFDSQSTVKDCATVFALSTMLSSVQIYNLSQNIQEDDLQHLQLFTDYGRLALEKSGTTPFQRLQFLIRDWSYPYEADFGSEGGRKILNRRLEISEMQHPQLQSLRKHITACFSDISCFLLPHPGLKIATNPNYDGRLSEIEEEFKKQLKTFVPMILHPRNLVTKKINGQTIKAKELIEYFKSYINIYQSDEIPEPKSMLLATAEANNLSAVAEAKDMYLQLMECVCGGTKPFLATATLETEHQRCEEKALNHFQNKRKMGGDEFSQMYMEKLQKDLLEAFSQFKGHNESKNIFKSARTPAVYFALAVVMYVASGVFGLFGIYSFSNFCNLVMGVSMLVLALWSYIRYSGEFQEIGQKIDELASLIWDHLMKPVYQGLVEKSATAAAVQAAGILSNPAINATIATANGKQKST